MDVLVSKALSAIEEVLSLPTPDTEAENYLRVIGMKKDAAVSIINAGLKADENRFRKRNSDVLARLLDALDRDQMPVLIPAPVSQG